MKRKILFFVLLMVAMSFNSYSQNLKYQGEVNVACALGYGDWSYNRFNVETVHGFRLTDNFFVGAGVGWHSYSRNADEFISEDERFSIIPIFFDVKGYLTYGKISPYATFDIGYSITTGMVSGHNGFYFAPGVGASYNISGKNAISLGLSLQSQTMAGYPSRLTMNSFAIKVGFTF